VSPEGPGRAGGRGRPRVVVLRALGLGDLLTSVPALRGLARAFPAHERLLVAPEALAPLAALVDAGCQPAVHGLVAHRGLGPLPAAVHGAEVAVNLHGRGPQSHRVLREAAAGRLVAFRHPDAHPDPEAPAWRAGEHEVDRWCRMLAAHGIPADPDDLHIRRPRCPPGWRGRRERR
jgi:hypothetical protein